MKKLQQKSALVLAHVHSELGVDFQKYENPELVGKMMSIVNIQGYSIKALLTPMLIAYVLLVTTYFFLDLGILGTVFYFMIGSFLFIASGILYGILRLVSNLKNDLQFIIKSILDFTQNVCCDLQHVSGKCSEVQNPVGLVFEGAVASLVMPSLCKTFKKIPIGGKILANCSYKALALASSEVKKHEHLTPVSGILLSGHTLIVDKTTRIEQNVSSILQKVDSFVEEMFSKIQFPVQLMFTGSAAVTAIFVLFFKFM